MVMFCMHFCADTKWVKEGQSYQSNIRGGLKNEQ